MMHYTVYLNCTLYHKDKSQLVRRQHRKRTSEKSDMVTYEDSTKVVRKGELIKRQTKCIQQLYLFWVGFILRTCVRNIIFILRTFSSLNLKVRKIMRLMMQNYFTPTKKSFFSSCLVCKIKKLKESNILSFSLINCLFNFQQWINIKDEHP